MTQVVDARGLACPQPVILARKAMQDAAGDPIEVWVDSATARENVQRAAEKAGLRVDVRQSGDEFVLLLYK